MRYEFVQIVYEAIMNFFLNTGRSFWIIGRNGVKNKPIMRTPNNWIHVFFF